MILLLDSTKAEDSTWSTLVPELFVGFLPANPANPASGASGASGAGTPSGRRNDSFCFMEKHQRCGILVENHIKINKGATEWRYNCRRV
ncbi:MAG: hypothetical protein ACYC49_14000 [Ignavibacteriaceae bacterium]